MTRTNKPLSSRGPISVSSQKRPTPSEKNAKTNRKTLNALTESAKSTQLASGGGKLAVREWFAKENSWVVLSETSKNINDVSIPKHGMLNVSAEYSHCFQRTRSELCEDDFGYCQLWSRCFFECISHIVLIVFRGQVKKYRVDVYLKFFRYTNDFLKRIINICIGEDK